MVIILKLFNKKGWLENNEWQIVGNSPGCLTLTLGDSYSPGRYVMLSNYLLHIMVGKTSSQSLTCGRKSSNIYPYSRQLLTRTVQRVLSYSPSTSGFMFEGLLQFTLLSQSTDGIFTNKLLFSIHYIIMFYKRVSRKLNYKRLIRKQLLMHEYGPCK